MEGRGRGVEGRGEGWREGGEVAGRGRAAEGRGKRVYGRGKRVEGRGRGGMGGDIWATRTYSKIISYHKVPHEQQFCCPPVSIATAFLSPQTLRNCRLQVATF